ncbi:unnamed protein product [Closterium sp. Naga37s-1]|nr:unnamed protein product [Closterium sp. Naga37s-1]
MGDNHGGIRMRGWDGHERDREQVPWTYHRGDTAHPFSPPSPLPVDFPLPPKSSLAVHPWPSISGRPSLAVHCRAGVADSDRLAHRFSPENQSATPSYEPLGHLPLATLQLFLFSSSTLISPHHLPGLRGFHQMLKSLFWGEAAVAQYPRVKSAAPGAAELQAAGSISHSSTRGTVEKMVCVLAHVFWGRDFIPSSISSPLPPVFRSSAGSAG